MIERLETKPKLNLRDRSTWVPENAEDIARQIDPEPLPDAPTIVSDFIETTARHAKILDFLDILVRRRVKDHRRSNQEPLTIPTQK